MAYRDMILAEAASPLIYLEFEGNITDTKAFTGTGGSPSYVAGKVGQAASLSGSSTITINSTNSYFTDRNWAVEFWFKTLAGGATLFSRGAGLPGISIKTHADGYIQATVSGNSAQAILLGTKIVTDNQWHHVVVSCESQYSQKLYVDGVLEATSATSLGSSMNLTGQATIGGTSNASYDEFVIYSNYLDQTVVTNHYNATMSLSGGYTAQASTASAAMTNAAVTAEVHINAQASAQAILASAGMAGVSVTAQTIIHRPISVQGVVGSASATITGAAYVGNVRKYYPASEEIIGSGTPGLHFLLTFDVSNINYFVSEAIIQLSANSAQVAVKNDDGSYGENRDAVLENGRLVADITDIVSDWVSGARNERTLRINSDSLALASYNVPVEEWPTIVATLGNSLPAVNKVVPAGLPGTASAEMPGGTPSVTFNPDVTLAMPLVGSANAGMTQGNGFVSPVDLVADVMTAEAEVVNPAVAAFGNVQVKVSASKANAEIILPAEGRNEIFDAYYNRIRDRFEEGTSGIWLRLDETEGTVAANRLSGGNAEYVNGIEFGEFGPEGRRAVTFDGVDDFIKLPDNDVLAAQGTVEFTFRTTTPDTDIITGIDAIAGQFGTSARGTFLGLRDGKVVVQPTFSANNNVRASSLRFVGRTNLADGNWHTITMTTAPSNMTVWIDGRLEMSRTLTQGVVWTAVPDTIGGGSYVGGSEYNPMDSSMTAPYIPFKGDMMEFLYTASASLSGNEVIENHYAIYGIVPVRVGAATASATMTADNKGKGNSKRALALWYTGNYSHRVANDWDVYNWTNIPLGGTFDIALKTPDKLAFNLGEFAVHTKYIGGDESATGDVYLGGAYYDEVTGGYRWIDLTKDIDMSDYDLVFFLNLPPTRDLFGNEYLSDKTYAQEFEELMANLRAAQDEHGFAIWAPQPEVALGLGIISDYDVHTMDRGTDSYSGTVTPWFKEDMAGANFWDTHALNKGRIVAAEEGLTDLGGYILKDYVYGYTYGGNDFRPPFEAWDYEERPNGLLVGDEMFYPQDFYQQGNSANSMNVTNARKSVVSVPANAVLAGKVILKENLVNWNDKTPVENPWKDNAISIVVKPGDSVKGSPVSGKIYVDFMFAPNSLKPHFLKQIVPDNDLIRNEADRETEAMRKWDYSSTRVSLIGSVGTTFTVLTPQGERKSGLVDEAQYKEAVYELIKKGFLVSVNEIQKYVVLHTPNYDMWDRALNWLADDEVYNAGDKKVAIGEAASANAEMAQPAVVVQKDVVIGAQASVAYAEIRKPANVLDGDTKIHVFPMVASATITGYGKTISVAPMTATAKIVENFDMVHARGENVVLTLNYTDAIVYLKEDS